MKHNLTEMEIATIRKKNAEHLDFLVLSLPQRCGNPYCQLPLPIQNNFRLLEYGDVCELCYNLFKLLSESAYWNRVSLEATQKPKKKDDDDHYGMSGYKF